MEHAQSFAPLLVVLLLAFAVPLVLRRFKHIGIPIVVGEIIAGIVVGRSGLRWVTDEDPLLNILAGLEVDFSNLGVIGGKRMRLGRGQIGPVPLGGLAFGLTLVSSSVIGLIMVGLDLARNPWMIALILSTTSLGVVMPILKERGLSTGRYGQAILVAALIADFGTMLLITVLVATVSKGLTLEILFVGFLFLAFFLLYHLGAFTNRVPGVRHAIEELSHATAQIKVRLAFTLMLVFVVLSQALGAEIILGAFLAGAVVSLLRTPEDAELQHKLEAIGFGFFIPLFFIEVGLRFNLSALLASPSAMLLVPILLLAAIAVKVLPSLLFRLLFTWREALGAGSLLSARLSLIIAASAIGLRLGLITEPVNAAIILVAVVTVTVAPLAFVRLIGEAEKRGPRPLLVFGMSELGLHVARNLREHRELVVALDPDEGAVARARQHGLEALLVTQDIGGHGLAKCLEAADTVICAHHDPETNYRFAQTARGIYGIDHVIVNLDNPGDVLRFEQLGAKPMNPALDQASLLALVARNPTTYELLTRTDNDKEVWEVAVCEGPHLGKMLRELSLPGDVLVLALRRNGDLLMPHGNPRVECDDRLTLAGSLEWVETARAMLAYGNGRS